MTCGKVAHRRVAVCRLAHRLIALWANGRTNLDQSTNTLPYVALDIHKPATGFTTLPSQLAIASVKRGDPVARQPVHGTLVPELPRLGAQTATHPPSSSSRISPRANVGAAAILALQWRFGQGRCDAVR